MEENVLNNQNDSVTNGGENQPNGTELNSQESQTFDDILRNKEYQAEFDRRVQKALTTAQQKWEAKNDADKTEAERLAQMNETERLQYMLKQKEKEIEDKNKKLNARDLKDEAIKIATNPETSFELEFLNLFKFEDMTAEDLQEKTKTLKAIQDRIVEKTVNEWSKEKSPYNPNQDGQSNNETQLAEAFGNITN